MKTMIEALNAMLNHFGEQLAIETITVNELYQDLSNDPEAPEELVKMLNDLRHQLGSAAAASRNVLNKIKYVSED